MTPGSRLALVLGFVALASGATAYAEAPSDYVTFESLAYRDRVEASGLLTRSVEARVLLRTATAVTELGQLQWPYVVTFAEVAFEDVAIEKADGRKVEVKDGLIEDVNPFGVTVDTASSDIRFKKLTIPGLEPGDRLSYRIVTRQKPVAAGFVFGAMKIPMLVGEPLQTYELDLPREVAVRVRLRPGLGSDWEPVPSAADRLVRRLRVRVPRPAADTKVTKRLLQVWSEPDVIYTSFATWNEVAQWWWALSKDRLQPDASVRKQAEELCPPGLSPRDTLVALYRFVAAKVRYLNVGFGIGRMQPHAAADVLLARYGDCKDKHALLAALAASVGLDVRPVLVGSARADLSDDVPAPQQFDHMISVARLGPDPASWLWLDATDRFGVPGQLNSQLRGKRALLIEPTGEGRLVQTPGEPPFVPRLQVEFKGALRPDGTLAGRTVWQLRSDGELFMRASLDALSQAQRTEVIKKSLAAHWKDAKVEDVVVSDTADPSEALRVEFSAAKTVHGDPDKTEWSLWVPLPDLGLPTPPDTTTPDTEKIDLDQREVTFRAEIEVPETFGARAPLSVSLARPFGKFESAYSVEGRRLVASRTLRLARSSLAPEEFAPFAALRKAIQTDHDQTFLVTGKVAPAGAASAESLHKQGLAAMEKRDYVSAMVLLTAATKSDPKLEDGFFDLGRALYQAGLYKEAVDAYTHQIELTPFHESAYSWRSSALTRLKRPEEAEKDLLKQIEVAPFQAWPYETLAARRLWQGRHREAADLFARAAAVEPGKPGRWVDLGWELARDGRPEEARQALTRARSLDPPDWLKVSAAGAYERNGDFAAAAEYAVEGLDPMAKRLAGLSADRFGNDDTWSAEYLARAWHILGSAALAAGDLAKADRYLTAAWSIYFLPQAGWSLGELREKQGRLAEALEFRAMAERVPTAGLNLPGDRQKRSTPEPDVGGQLTGLRTVPLGGGFGSVFAEDVLLLMASDGHVEGIREASPKAQARLAPVLEALNQHGTIRLPFTPPDDRPFRAVRKALLACSAATPCSLILDLPGLPPLAR